MSSKRNRKKNNSAANRNDAGSGNGSEILTQGNSAASPDSSSSGSSAELNSEYEFGPDPGYGSTEVLRAVPVSLGDQDPDEMSPESFAAASAAAAKAAQAKTGGDAEVKTTSGKSDNKSDIKTEAKAEEKTDNRAYANRGVYLPPLDSVETEEEHWDISAERNREKNKDNNAEPEDEEDTSFNRSNVNRLKRIILIALLLLFLIPTVLCIVLFFKMHGMQNEMDALKEETISRKKQAAMMASNNKDSNNTDNTQANYDLEQSAYASLEKDKNTGSMILHQAQPEDSSAELDLTGIDLTDVVNKDMFVTEEATTEEPEREVVTTASGETSPENWNGKKVYLTFDDGPSENTVKLLNILKIKDVRATFFLVLDDTEQETVVRRMANDGHALGIHSASHVYGQIYADLYSFKKDVETVHDLLYEMTGQDVRLYRFPGGSSNRVATVDIDECLAYLKDEGYTYYDWNALSEDAEAEYTEPSVLNANVLRYIRGNSGDSVVLLHDLDGHPESLESLPLLIDTLKQEGYWLLPIDKDTEPVQHRTLLTEEELAELAAAAEASTAEDTMDTAE